MIIAFTGKAGAGKTTAVNMLQVMLSNYDETWSSYAFARPLKAMLAAAGFHEPEVAAMKQELIPGMSFSWRDAAQKLGTEWGRSLDPDIWVKIAELEYTAIRQQGFRGMLIGDLRFENEATIVRKHGYIVHITGRQHEMRGNLATHASEAGVEHTEQDLQVVNGGSLSDLRNELDMVLRHLGYPE